MFKNILKISLFIVVLSAPILVSAQASNLPNPGTLPDSPLYFLKEWREGIQLFFAFGAEAKAKQYLHLAEVRLAEYEKMVEKGKQEIAEKTIVKYQNQLDRAVQKAQELSAKGGSASGGKAKSEEKAKEVLGKIQEATSKHLQVLQDNLARVPEAAKKGLEMAIETSQKGIEKIKGAVEKNKEARGEISSDTSNSSASLTAGWKTYRNERDGFEFRYPSSFTLYTDPSSYWREAYTPSYLYRFLELVNPTDGCYIGPVKEVGLGFDWTFEEKQLLLADGTSIAIRYSYSPEGKLKYIAPKMMQVRNWMIPLEITTLSNKLIMSDRGSSATSDDLSRNCINDFERILSTFKFIEPK